MANTTLTSAQVGEFCEGLALMQSVGITLAEGVALLAEGYGEGAPQREVLAALYRPLAEGSSLAEAMGSSGAFPASAVRMVDSGERTGRLEPTLLSLAHHYDEQARLFARIRRAVAYPCALLCVMSVILLFCVVGILPVFASVYGAATGGIAGASAGFVNAGMVIGWVALVVVLVLTVCALVVYAASRSERGRERLLRVAEKLPGLRGPLRSIALSRFVSTLAVHIASGSHVDAAMEAAVATVEDDGLRARVEPAHEAMVQSVRPVGLVDALVQHGVVDETTGRMLEFGSRSGSIDDELAKLAERLFEDGIDRFDGVIDMVEPVLIALLTVAIGATLVAAMLPLVGIFGAIG